VANCTACCEFVGEDWSAAGSANRSESLSVGTATTGSFDWASWIAADERVLNDPEAAVFGGLHASVVSPAGCAAGTLLADEMAVAAGAALLCITGSGSPG
jgi:hypothetical protein